MDNADFIRTAEKIYKENSLMFGFAFWKYREHMKSGDVFDVIVDGVRHMYVISKNRLVYYWSDDDRMIIDDKRLSEFSILTLNSKYRVYIDKLRETHAVNEGVAQVYDMSYKENKFTDDYFTDYFNFSQDCYQEALDIINEDGRQMSLDYIKSFTKLSVFDRNLWVLVRNKTSGEAVSIGISVYDNVIKETDLEWIFVKKEHQGKRVGRMLIAETVRRAIGKSDIIRVGGIADDFYYKCGFQISTDQGFWLKKYGSTAGWWD